MSGQLDFEAMHEEYLNKQEIKFNYQPNVLQSFRGSSTLESIDAEDLNTARANAIQKRIRGEQTKQSIKVILVIFEIMTLNRRIGDFQTLRALTMLCRKLHKTLDPNKIMYFISEQQRLNLYIYKSNVYTLKQFKFLQNVLNQHQEERKQDYTAADLTEDSLVEMY